MRTIFYNPLGTVIGVTEHEEQDSVPIPQDASDFRTFPDDVTLPPEWMALGREDARSGSQPG